MKKNSINDNHLICIGVPVRNGAKTIRKTLDSILNQTYKNFHVIISVKIFVSAYFEDAPFPEQ